jgi:hypothetical protein
MALQQITNLYKKGYHNRGKRQPAEWEKESANRPGGKMFRIYTELKQLKSKERKGEVEGREGGRREGREEGKKKKRGRKEEKEREERREGGKTNLI